MTSGLDGRTPAPQPPAKPVESLRRELLAILFLYAAVAVLPFLIGMALAP